MRNFKKLKRKKCRIWNFLRKKWGIFKKKNLKVFRKNEKFENFKEKNLKHLKKKMRYLKNQEINWEFLNYSKVKFGGLVQFLRNIEIIYNIQRNNDNLKIIIE